MVFSFDTCVFINLKNSNPRLRNEALWTMLEDLLRRGRILVSKEVYFELQGRDDVLAPWLNEFTENIIENDLEIQNHIIRLSNRYENWIDPNSTEPFADPYVIAIALSKEGAVVTSERLNENHAQNPVQMINQSHAVKIPNICEQEGIECFNFIAFLVNIGQF